MAKRKLEPSSPASPPAKRLPPSILKTENSPVRSTKKIVSFPPPAELSDTLKLFSKTDGILEDVDLSQMISLVETLKGPSLVMWLAELQVFILINAFINLICSFQIL